MQKSFRERLTYRSLFQWMSLLIALTGALLGMTNTPVRYEASPVFTVLAMLGGLFVFVLTLLFPQFLDQPIFPRAQDKPIPQEVRRKNRQDMLTLIEKIWIEGYLDHIMNEMHSLNFDLAFAEPDKVLQKAGMADYRLPDSGAILQVFNDQNRRLVILGEPGAGKTVLLLQLLEKLIAEARNDTRRPIPMVLALSSWAAKQLPFEEWLRGEIREKYGRAQRVADDLVRGEQLVYLLDGLDVVAEAQRDACLKVFNEFVAERKPEYVLCSRRQEYQELATRPNVVGEVLIEPLRPAQIEGYLRGDEFAGLRAILKSNAILEGFARIPFMLNTMSVVALGKTGRQLALDTDKKDTPEALRDYFLETYVNRRMKDKTHPHYTDFSKIRTYLKWLAGQLVKHNQTDFHIESLQPDWLDTQAQRKRYAWSYRLVFGLAFALWGGLGVGLVYGLLFGLLDGLVYGLVYGLLVGLVYELLAGLVGGLALGLVYGLVAGLLVGLWVGISVSETVQLRLRPDEGIRRSALNGLVYGLLAGLLVGLVYGLGDGAVYAYALGGGPALGLLDWLLVGLRFGLAGGLRLGLDTTIKHAILRFYLARAGAIPPWLWRYDRFLDYAAELVILHKVGGGYRFVHDYLRQYLASARFVPEAAGAPAEDG